MCRWAVSRNEGWKVYRLCCFCETEVPLRCTIWAKKLACARYLYFKYFRCSWRHSTSKGRQPASAAVLARTRRARGKAKEIRTQLPISGHLGLLPTCGPQLLQNRLAVAKHYLGLAVTVPSTSGEAPNNLCHRGDTGKCSLTSATQERFSSIIILRYLWVCT